MKNSPLISIKQTIAGQIQKLLSFYSKLNQKSSEDEMKCPDSTIKEAEKLVNEANSMIDNIISKNEDVVTEEPQQTSSSSQRRFSSKPSSQRQDRTCGRFIRKKSVGGPDANVSRVDIISKYASECNMESAKGIIEGGMESQIYNQIINNQCKPVKPAMKRFYLKK